MDELTEDKARQMDAGPELNRICAEWWGAKPKYKGIEGHTPDVHHYFSADWSAAGPLLEAMTGVLNPLTNLDKEDKGCEDRDEWECISPWLGGDIYATGATAPTPQLAIARACAVLVARGISRDELEN